MIIKVLGGSLVLLMKAILMGQNCNQGNRGYRRQYQPYYNRNSGTRGGYRGGGRKARFAGSRPPRAVEDPAAIASAD
jgi:hypothetical protein